MSSYGEGLVVVFFHVPEGRLRFGFIQGELRGGAIGRRVEFRVCQDLLHDHFVFPPDLITRFIGWFFGLFNRSLLRFS